jgi:eukaryotic-like serine/threonine-protein kinase
MKSSIIFKKALSITLGLGLLAACQPQATGKEQMKIPPAAATGPTIIQQTSKRGGMDIVMVFVPGGEFSMGSPDSDPGAGSDMKPQHKVTLDPFWIDRTEVTNAMYAQCVEAGACRSPTGVETAQSAYGDPQYDHYPVEGISWKEGQTYCEWAGSRLPSEAEWEKAARGKDGRIYPWGSQAPTGTLLNFDRTVGGPSVVGSYPAGISPYGALDMAGNLWEWVADWYSHNYYTHSPSFNPLESEPQAYHACRGGSWNSSASRVRADYRGNEDPGQCDGLTTVRCARSAH